MSSSIEQNNGGAVVDGFTHREEVAAPVVEAPPPPPRRLVRFVRVQQPTQQPSVTQVKIKLSSKMYYPNVIRCPKNKAPETINGEVKASEPDPITGERWLGLYDVVCMFTGKSYDTARRVAERNKFSICIERHNVLTQIGSGAWKPTPAIRSSDLMKVGVALNASIASAAAVTQTRLIGGDLSLAEEATLNRARQEGADDSSASEAGAASAAAARAAVDAAVGRIAEVVVVEGSDTSNTNESKIYLNETMHYPGVTRKCKNKSLETIDGVVKASEYDPITGERWLSLYDVVCMFTGKTVKTIQNFYGNTNSRISGVGIERQNVLTQIGSGAWKPTPAIRSSDLMKVGVALNASIASAAAVTQTRLIGGDLSLAEEATLNRARQEVLAEHDPTHILRVSGEAVEGLSPAIISTAAAADEAVAAAMPPVLEEAAQQAAAAVASKILPRLSIAERFGLSREFIADQERLDLKSKKRMYKLVVTVREDAPPLSESEAAAHAERCDTDGPLISSRVDAPRGLIKGGITENFIGRLIKFKTIFAENRYDLAVNFVETMERASHVETRVNQKLRNRGILQSKRRALWVVGEGGVTTKLTEAFVATETFESEDYDRVYEDVKSQIGIPLVTTAAAVATPTPPSERYRKDYELEKLRLELEKIKLEREREISLINLLSPEDKAEYAKHVLFTAKI